MVKNPDQTDSEQDKDILRLATHLPAKGDRTLAILKGHLLLEELIRELISSKMERPECLQENRFEFDQCLSLAKALTGNEHSEWEWKALKKLNKLRNDLAHNLEPKGAKDRVDDFISYVNVHMRRKDGKHPSDLMDPLNWAIAGLYIHFSINLRFKPQAMSLQDWIGPSA